MNPFMHARRRESGAALIISLIMLIVLTGLGIATMNKARFQERITNNQKIETLTFLTAEGALEEGKERYENSQQTGTMDTSWRQYVGTAASATEYFNYDSGNSNHHIDSTDLSGDYTVEYRHKTEWDMQAQGHTTAAPIYDDLDGSTALVSAASPGNVIYYGYVNAGDTVARYFSPSGITSANPVEVVTSVAWMGNSRRTLEIEMVKNPGPPIQGTIYSKQDVTVNGSSGNFSGVDNCGSAPSVPPVYTKTPAITTTSGSPTFSGSPPNPVSGSNDIDISYLITILKKGASVITSDTNGASYGSAANNVTMYSNTSNPYNNNGLKLSNVTGYGLLLVEGDLVLGGNASWNGVILVTGTITFNGGGHPINLFGATFSEQSVDINGGLDLRYDSCNIQDAMESLPLVVTQWRQVQ